ncbi:hypothetical protein H0A36_13555 [Endozoicomonas sp. SM1973]|uniref:Solute-binding protein family 3/N-terminal domain-containing protein n=1 Tax=Spartinivicinus marinus TaxID=2994442 RepID=A0A853IB35_9GAMM|nr:hypothetical protein [Spartinivicinus marinus]MCX4027045.1 hypothetical protein [Spartinivicinus marinus]NYZ67041.1 hypothetical protein [Spartinivicinus marinus]
MIYLKRIGFIALFSLSMSVYSTQSVDVWTYYRNPPFVVNSENNHGLTYKFFCYINIKYKNKIEFTVHFIPRRRIDYYLSKGKAGVVPWVSPLFFNDNNMDRYLWSQTIIDDQQDIISLTTNKVTYSNKQALIGLLVGAIIGHRYTVIDDLVEDNLMFRKDFRNEKIILNVLLNNRVDFITLPRSTIQYYIRSLGLEEKLYISPKPLQSYTRRLLITPNLKNVHQFFIKVLPELIKSPAWFFIKEQYDFDENTKFKKELLSKEEAEYIKACEFL